MSEPQPEPAAQEAPSVAAQWRARFQAALPFIITAVVAVALSLLGQAALQALQIPAAALISATPTLPPATATPAPPPTSETQPTAAPPPLQPDARILAQQILDLRAELRNTRSDKYLILAAFQLTEAEYALRVNNLDEVERVLTTAWVALDRAYTYAEAYKNPIDDFRAQVGKLREDLRVYPEGMDQRLRRLRQNILSLVDDSG